MKVKIVWGFNTEELEVTVNTWLEENKDKAILSVGGMTAYPGINGYYIQIFYTEPSNVFEPAPAVPPKSSTALDAAIEALTRISKAHEEGWSRDVAKSALKKISELGG